MSNRAPLVRMMFLIIFLFIVLVIFYTRLSKNTEYNRNDPIYNKRIILNNKDQGYSVLLHSIVFNDSSISAYSAKYDSIMTFPAMPKDFKIIQKKLGSLPYKAQQCNTCHDAMGN